MVKKMTIPALAAMALLMAGTAHAGTVSGIAPNEINYNKPAQVAAAINKQKAIIAKLRAEAQTNQNTMRQYEKKIGQVHLMLPKHGTYPDKYIDGEKVPNSGNGKGDTFNLKPVPNMKDKKAQIAAQNQLIFELNAKIDGQKDKIDRREKHYAHLAKMGDKHGLNLGNINTYSVAQLTAMAKKDPAQGHKPNKGNNKPHGFPPLEEYQPPFNAHGPLPVDDEKPFNAHGPLPIDDEKPGYDGDNGDNDSGYGGHGDSDGGRPEHGDGDNDGGYRPDHESAEMLGGGSHDMEDMGHGKGGRDRDRDDGGYSHGGGGGHKVPAPPVLGLMGMAMFAIARRRKKRAA